MTIRDDLAAILAASKDEWTRDFARAQRDGTHIAALAERQADVVLAWLGDTNARVEWLLTAFDLWSEDGVFTFPDGETYVRDDP